MLEAVRSWSLSLAVDKSEDLLAASIRQSFLFDNLLFGILGLSRPRDIFVSEFYFRLGKFPLCASEFCSDLENFSGSENFSSQNFFFFFVSETSLFSEFFFLSRRFFSDFENFLSQRFFQPQDLSVSESFSLGLGISWPRILGSDLIFLACRSCRVLLCVSFVGVVSTRLLYQHKIG